MHYSIDKKYICLFKQMQIYNDEKAVTLSMLQPSQPESKAYQKAVN